MQDHPPSALSAIPQACRLPAAAGEQIQVLASAGVTPKQIQSMLLTTWPNLPLSQRDIVNYIYRRERTDFAALSMSYVNPLWTTQDFLLVLYTQLRTA